MPIYMADLHTDYVIREITGSDKVKAHLSNLGFIPGETINVVSRVDDNVIVKIKGVSLAISDILAKRILV